jgi:hypothetical protein
MWTHELLASAKTRPGHMKRVGAISCWVVLPEDDDGPTPMTLDRYATRTRTRICAIGGARGPGQQWKVGVNDQLPGGNADFARWAPMLGAVIVLLIFAILMSRV